MSNVTAPAEAINAAANPDAAAGKCVQMDIKTTRDRWGCGNDHTRKYPRFMFVCGTLGAAIGLGNMWKFPNLTFKHGGVAFIVAYVIVLILAGIPMLTLELTLG